MFSALAVTSVLAGAILGGTTTASPTPRACNSYIVIDTRGTSEFQGPSLGFLTMVSELKAALPGGVEHDTVYPAAWNQNSTLGTEDILNTINSGVSSCPDQKYALLGYSQGAAATVNALPDITGAAFDAVKAVILIGNPERLPGKQSNIDGTGSSGAGNTASCSGIESDLGGIPDNWDESGKVLDICLKGDGVCCGTTITIPHLGYPFDSTVQNIGYEFLKSQLS